MDGVGTSSCVDASKASEGTTTPARSTKLPSLVSQFVPIVKEEMLPVEGMVFETLEEAESFYNAYAESAAFDVRIRSTNRKDDNKDEVITRKRLVCTREGVRSNSKKDRKYKQKVTRCKCPAEIRFKRADDGRYVVMKFVAMHSHSLHTPTKVQFLSSSRQVDSRAKRALLACDKVNIGLAQTYDLLNVQVGGYENIGCTQRDLRNFKGELRMLVADSDAQMFVDKLNTRKEVDPNFYYEIELDEDRRLKNIFWADSNCRKNYILFGDVVSFDSTYDTNKYKMVFAPFTGINHHMCCVSFGVALLGNELGETYAWLFKAFLKCMEGKEPNVIITDEDPAMKKAIGQVFEHTKHRLCMWHIMQKCPVQISSEVWGMEDFRARFKSCVWNSETPTEFEILWPSLLSDYGLENNKWLNNKFAGRCDWIPAYYKDVFLAGLLRTTSRSESENAFFSRFLNHTISLVEFWVRFESALERQRHKEIEDDNESINKTIELKTNSSFEKQGVDVFTHEVFLIFQNEVCDAVDVCISKGYKEYMTIHVHTIGHRSSSKRRAEPIREVQYDRSNGVVKCSCKKFESIGIPCCHILFVLHNEDLNELPSNLVLDRWTKKINRKSVFNVEGSVLLPNSLKRIASVAFANLEECCIIAGQDYDKFEAIGTCIVDLRKSLGSPPSRDKTQELNEYIGSSVPDKIEIHLPKEAHTKGSGAGGKRIKGGLEKAIENQNKKARKCRACGELVFDHDFRNCPTRRT